MDSAIKNKAFDYRTPEYIRSMKQYVNDLKRSAQDPVAIENARNSLIQAGIADKDGHVKEKIVSWE